MLVVFAFVCEYGHTMLCPGLSTWRTNTYHIARFLPCVLVCVSTVAYLWPPMSLKLVAYNQTNTNIPIHRRR